MAQPGNVKTGPQAQKQQVGAQPQVKTGPTATKQPAQPQGLSQNMPAGQDPEFERRKAGWDQVLSELSTQPGAASFLTTMGAQLLQPVQAGQTAVGNLGAAADRAMRMQQELQGQQFQQQMAQEEQALQEQRVQQQQEQFEARQTQQQEQFEAEQALNEEQFNERMDYLRDKLGQERAMAWWESVREGQGGTDIDRQKLLQNTWESIRKQREDDRMDMDPEQFQEKWGNSIQDDIVEAYRRQLQILSGTTETTPEQEVVAVSGQELQRLGYQQDSEGNEISADENYQMAPEQWAQVKENAPNQEAPEQQSGSQESEAPEDQGLDITPDEARRQYNQLLRETADALNVDIAALDSRIKSGTEGTGSIGTDFMNFLGNLPGIEGRNVSQAQEAQQKVDRLRQLMEAQQQ